MDGIVRDTRPDERLQAAAVRDIDADREQVREVLRNPDVFEKPDGRLWVKLDQNIDIATALAVPRAEPNNAAWPNPRPPQLGLVSSQFGDDLSPIDAVIRAGLTANLFNPHVGPFRHSACLSHWSPADYIRGSLNYRVKARQ